MRFMRRLGHNGNASLNSPGETDLTTDHLEGDIIQDRGSDIPALASFWMFLKLELSTARWHFYLQYLEYRRGYLGMFRWERFIHMSSNYPNRASTQWLVGHESNSMPAGHLEEFMLWEKPGRIWD